ncbi:expressed unknown protein [Seminavis robusta]|uniref:Hemerythrin-like domain-containing protein n=1 Tax=Seminavis robusta TaxID=568900 RepID=A0A9N8HW44_9STRA|nr:expressed unknown protein [Seminavis robusta]|eukprot:Sro1596_g284820.1 n/a (266) ;mRNA; f:19021-19818
MTTNQTIDVTDLQYQASKSFLPDKESLWKFPQEHDGWVHAHNAIRGEMQTIEDCFRVIQSRSKKQPQLQNWEAAALRTVFDAHVNFVHVHHTNEDDIITPWLATRVNLPSKLTDDHAHIVRDMKSIQTRIHGLKGGDNRDTSMAALLTLWKPYTVTMREHLQEEEDIGLPLLRAYFTPKELLRTVMKLSKKESSNPLVTGTFVHHMGKDHCRKEFMKEHDVPSFVWYIAFARPLKMYEKQVVSVVKAIHVGVEPVPVKRGGLWCC